jgi:WhiB family transcriptional regulator, redox-sensing transcriptional regulator
VNGFDTNWMPWMNDAVCVKYPDLHYPPGSTHTSHETFTKTHKPQIEDAKEMCHHCPVQPQCLTHALTHNERHGIWGGTTPSERAKLRKEHP